MSAFTWAGTAAASLIAIGTVLRWIIRRAVRASAWIGALVALPSAVADLAAAVREHTAAARPCPLLTPISEEPSHAVHPR